MGDNNKQTATHHQMVGDALNGLISGYLVRDGLKKTQFGKYSDVRLYEKNEHVLLGHCSGFLPVLKTWCWFFKRTEPMRYLKYHKLNIKYWMPIGVYERFVEKGSTLISQSGKDALKRFGAGAGFSEGPGRIGFFEEAIKDALAGTDFIGRADAINSTGDRRHKAVGMSNIYDGLVALIRDDPWTVQIDKPGKINKENIIRKINMIRGALINSCAQKQERRGMLIFCSGKTKKTLDSVIHRNMRPTYDIVVIDSLPDDFMFGTFAIDGEYSNLVQGIGACHDHEAMLDTKPGKGGREAYVGLTLMMGLGYKSGGCVYYTDVARKRPIERFLALLYNRFVGFCNKVITKIKF